MKMIGKLGNLAFEFIFGAMAALFIVIGIGVFVAAIVVGAVAAYRFSPWLFAAALTTVLVGGTIGIRKRVISGYQGHEGPG